MKHPEICIALAVYNGSSFLEEQLDSLFDQHYQNWRILTRDDGSQDDSLEILRRTAAEQSRVKLVQSVRGNQGVTQSFGLLLDHANESSCDYVALSDQDDVWYAEKLTELMKAMQRIEEQFPDLPVLIHSDLEVVDQNLNQIAASFMTFQGIQHESVHPLRILLAQNFVTGCTVLVNRKLLQLALPFPKEVIMHDWWLALCAAAMGKIEFINQPLIKYRQHEHNKVGAKSLLRMLNPLKNNYYHFWHQGQERLQRGITQAVALAERIRLHDLENPNLPLIDGFSQIQEYSPLKRIHKLRRLDIHMQSRLRHHLMLSRLVHLSTVDKVKKCSLSSS